MNTRTSILSRIAHDKRGNVGITFGLMILPAVMFVGGAIDFGKAYHMRQKIQAAADAAVLAAAAMPEGTQAAARQARALAIFSANTSGMGTVTPNAQASGNSVSITATGNMPTSFLKLAHLDSLSVGGSASAQVGYTTTTGQVSTDSISTGKVCILALDPSSSVIGIQGQGTVSASYENCWAHTNSTNASGAISGGGSGSVVGAGHSAVGGKSSNANTVFSPAVSTGQAAIADPFATNEGGAYGTGTYTTTFTAPTIPNACTGKGWKLQQGTFTLYPGRYCEKLEIQAGATVTFMPGDYIIEDGSFDIQSGATVTGNGVMFYLRQTQTANKYNTFFQVLGGGSVNFTARSNGTGVAEASRNGFLFIVDPSAQTNSNGASRVQGGGTFKMEGMIYAPKQNVQISGNGTTAASNNTNSSMFAIVAKSVEIDGNGSFYLKKHNGVSSLPDLLPTKTITTTTISTGNVSTIDKVKLTP